MRFVIDTNVVAYYLLRTKPFADEARRFLAIAGIGLAPAVRRPRLPTWCGWRFEPVL